MNNITCLSSKVSMIWASFMKKDYLNVYKAYNSLNTSRIQRFYCFFHLNCTQSDKVMPILIHAEVILAETYYNNNNKSQYIPIVKELTNSNYMQPNWISKDNKTVEYLRAVSQLENNDVSLYDKESYLNKIHHAVNSIFASGSIFYLNNSAHTKISLSKSVITFVTSMNYLIIGSLIASLIAFPVILRHYIGQESGPKKG